MNTEPQDLRFPTPDETMLSREEVLCGLREGTVAPGPVARAHAFAEVTVVTRRLVEVINFTEEPTCSSSE
jgi:hypothetical protein